MTVSSYSELACCAFSLSGSKSTLNLQPQMSLNLGPQRYTRNLSRGTGGTMTRRKVVTCHCLAPRLALPFSPSCHPQGSRQGYVWYSSLPLSALACPKLGYTRLWQGRASRSPAGPFLLTLATATNGEVRLSHATAFKDAVGNIRKPAKQTQHCRSLSCQERRKTRGTRSISKPDQTRYLIRKAQSARSSQLHHFALARRVILQLCHELAPILRCPWPCRGKLFLGRAAQLDRISW